MTSSPAKPSTKLATIDDLPAEMIAELFKYLSLNDLAACSMVNKRWHSIRAEFRLTRLVVSCKPGYDIYIDKWSHSGRKITDIERCLPEIFLRLADRPLITNLKYLSLNWFPELFVFDPNELNKFSQLVHLEIKIYNLVKESEFVSLSLPKLKVLNFHCHLWSLSVDCPVLSSLVYKNWSEGRFHLVVKQPETIRKLETNLVGVSLSPFQRVECLVTNRFRVISRDTLRLLPNLKELHFNENILSVLHTEYSNQLGSVERLKERLSRFLDDLQKLREPDFRFTFCGLQLTSWTLNQIDFDVEEHPSFEKVFNEHLYLKNEQLIASDVSLAFVTCFDYTRLMHVAGGEIPSWFFERFSHICQITVSGPVRDVDHFGWFLSSPSRLSSLLLRRAWLDQDFYDQLPSLAPQLVWLGLSEITRNELQINFDFIAKLPDLSILTIEQNLSFGSIASLISVFPKLAVFEKGYSSFKWRGNRVHLSKQLNSNLYELTGNICRETAFTTESPDEILDFLHQLPAYSEQDIKKRSLDSKPLSSYLSRPVDWIRSFCNKSTAYQYRHLVPSNIPPMDISLDDDTDQFKRFHLTGFST